MAEVQLIRSGERATETTAKAKTTGSSSTQFSEMLKGMTQSASEDKKASGTKQQKEDSRSTEKEASKKVDAEKEEAAQKTEKTEDGKEDKAEHPVSDLTGEDYTQLAELLAALSQPDSPIQEQKLTKEQGDPAVLSLENITETAGEETPSVTELFTAAEPELIQEALEPVQTDGTEEGASALEMLQDTTEIQQEAAIVQQDTNDEIVTVEASETEYSETEVTTEKVRDKAMQTTEAKEEEPSETEAAVSAAGQHTAVSTARPLSDTTAGVERMTMKTSPEELPKDLADAIVSRDILGNGTDTLEITLEPATLGKITLRVVYQEGRAALSLISDSSKTLELLSQKAGEIAQILEEKTGQDTVVFVPETSYTEQGQEDSTGQESRGRSDDRHERPKQEQAESFAQQLRLGLL